jgi:hypothetical protein
MRVFLEHISDMVWMSEEISPLKTQAEGDYLPILVRSVGQKLERIVP